MTQDIIDAEFETIRPADRPRTGGTTAGRPARPTVAKAGNDNDQIGLLKDAPAGARIPPVVTRTYAVAVAAAAVIAFLAAGGHVLLTGRPAAQPELTMVIQESALKPLSDRAVSVSATIRNDGGAPEIVPDVELVFESETGGSDLIYRLTRGETLGAGKTLAFTVQMPKKPGYRAVPRLRFDTNGV